MNKMPVSIVPSIGPDFGRIELTFPDGLTVAEIVELALAAASEAAIERARVWLINDRGEMLLSDRTAWRRIRPRAGTRIVIQLVAGKIDLKNILTIAITIAAVAIGQVWVGPAIAAATGSALLGSIGAAVTAGVIAMAGSFLINKLFPGPGALQAEKPLYQISGWQNTVTPDGVVPSVLGKVRVAPVFASPVYSEIVGDLQYIRALFTFGYGPVQLSQLKIKDTPIESYDEIDFEVRNGYSTDSRVTIYPTQVIEESLGVELRRDRLRDESGSIGGEGPITPTTRFTAGDANQANVIFHFPAGLISFNDEGKARKRSVTVRLRQRPAAGGAWQTVKEIVFSAKKKEGFFRQFKWTLPSRGRWEIEVARITSESTSSSVSDRVTCLALQSFRPEYPLNFSHPLCLVAVRVKATYQLNSTLDTFNAIAERLLPDWDHVTGTWITRPTRNPAAHFRHILQGPENTYAEPDSAIDLDGLQAWHDFCRLKGLKYDRDRSFESSTWGALTEIAAAGRAAPRYDGTKWSVVIDRPQDLVVAHVNSRNSRDFTWSRNYIDPPDAFRVQFLDETADYQARERIVRWPGYTGDINTTEQLELPGKTDPAEIWRETRRRQYEVIHRPDVFTAVQDAAVRTATRGDHVKGSYETLISTMAALKVSAVRGLYVTLDGQVEMAAGATYAIRFMRQVGTGDDATFESVLRGVQTAPGVTDSVLLKGDGYVPDKGTIVQFGLSGEESMDLVVAGVQAGEQMTTVLSMLASAPIIDTLTDAEVPPAWNGRAGSDAGTVIAVPAIPVVVGTEPYFDEDGLADGLIVLLSPGEGSTAEVATFSLRHRLAGTTTWSVTTADAGEGGITLTGYGTGASIEMQRLATSTAGYSSPWSDTFTVDSAVDGGDPPAPVTSGSVAGGTGDASFTVSTPADASIAELRLSYGLNADGTGAVEIITFAAGPLGSYSRTETVPAGTFYFFVETLNSYGTPSVGFSLGQATVL
ncbi:host specificity protein J [Rhizobium arsenicireducens]